MPLLPSNHNRYAKLPKERGIVVDCDTVVLVQDDDKNDKENKDNHDRGGGRNNNRRLLLAPFKAPSWRSFRRNTEASLFKHQSLDLPDHSDTEDDEDEEEEQEASRYEEREKGLLDKLESSSLKSMEAESFFDAPFSHVTATTLMHRLSTEMEALRSQRDEMQCQIDTQLELALGCWPNETSGLALTRMIRTLAYLVGVLFQFQQMQTQMEKYLLHSERNSSESSLFEPGIQFNDMCRLMNDAMESVQSVLSSSLSDREAIDELTLLLA